MTDLNDVAKEISADIVINVMAMLDKTWEELGEDVALAVNDQLIADMVASMVFQELTARPERKLKGKEKQAFVEANFNAVKQRLQESIASGFELATTKFSGIETQYYCQVKRIPTADKNKLC